MSWGGVYSLLIICQFRHSTLDWSGFRQMADRYSWCADRNPRVLAGVSTVQYSRREGQNVVTEGHVLLAMGRRSQPNE